MSKYLITFDMDTKCLSENYHGNSPNNAYADIARILKEHGFKNIQGSVYLGKEGISEAHGTLAIQELTARYDWFYSCVSNIRFYRLESDLNAQFIADGVHQAKQVFNKRMNELKASLVKAGLTESQVNDIMLQQKFTLENAMPSQSKTSHDNFKDN